MSRPPKTFTKNLALWKENPLQIVNQPVVFVHGNSDLALQRDSFSTYQTGWGQTVASFLKEGYTAAELYATTWGPAQSSQAQQQTHNCDYVRRIRRFIEAVLAYTKASKVSRRLVETSMWDM